MGYKKCPKCGLNYIKDEEDLCDVCRTTVRKSSAGKSHAGILENQQLSGQRFKVDYVGYGQYLMDRKYGIFTEDGAESTTMFYCRAIGRICQEEGIDFTYLLQHIDEYVRMYGLDGPKKERGEYGHGIWRNALNRLKDFKTYIEVYMK